MRKITYILLSLVLVSSAYGDTIYKWVDKAGVVNYTDDYTIVPPAYLDRVETQMMTETPTTTAKEGVLLFKRPPPKSNKR